VIYLDRTKLRAVRETAAWLIGRRRRIRVVGDSMLPTLEAGQFVLVDDERAPVPGELALATHPTERGVLVIKRVDRICPDGAFYLVSDNVSEGTDSRTWGAVSGLDVLGTVTLLLDHPAVDLSP